MSWSVSATAPRDEAIRQIREQFVRCTYLPAGEHGRAIAIIETVSDFATLNTEPTDVLKISAWGSESILGVIGGTEPTRVVGIQGGYSVAVERPAPVPSEPTTAAA